MNGLSYRERQGGAAARGWARSRRSQQAPRAIVSLPLAGWMAAGAACADAQPLQPVNEDIRIVSGVPTAEAVPREVHRRPAVDAPLTPLRPRLCQRVEQRRDPRVDVLWIHGLGNASPWDAEMAEGLRRFLAHFLDGEGEGDEAPADLHFGVIAADGDGRLVPPPGADAPFLACTPGPAGPRCNVGDGTRAEAEQALQALMASLAESASSANTGLLQMMRALSEPLRDEANAGFLRDDASLAVVAVSEADDTSCEPQQAPSVGPCHSFGACRCSELPAWGGTELFARFLRGLKGSGRNLRARFFSYAAEAAGPLAVDSPSTFVGCERSPAAGCASPWNAGGPCALHAPRYAALARSTGGHRKDLCEDEAPQALDEIGFLASGQFYELDLERFPLPSTIDAMVLSKTTESCHHERPCDGPGLDCIRGRCGRAVLEDGSNGWQYVTCSDDLPRNSLRLNGDAIPRHLQSVEVCYDVDVGAGPSPCP